MKKKITKKEWQLYSLCLIPILLVFVFSYIPMFGIIVAFKNYKYNLGILGSPWVGFKNFEFDGSTKEIKLWIRGNNTVGEFEVRTSINGEILARIPTHKVNFWEAVSAPISIPKGVKSLFFTYKGQNNISINGFELI